MLDGLFVASAIQRMADGNKSDTTGRMASRIASDVRTRTEAIESDVEKLLMITEALWGILKERHGYTDDDLVRRITEIDFRDGRIDGKVARSGPVECPKCGRKLRGKRPRCMYCGSLIRTDPFQR